LPAELYADLKRIGGKEWLWDGWNAECSTFRPGSNKLPAVFQASSVQCILANIFREYSDAHPDHPRLTPHAFRRRAITAMVTSTGSVDLTATALGINAQTARTYYLDASAAFDTNKAFEATTAALLPKV
jgi:hypothetical protein